MSVTTPPASWTSSTPAGWERTLSNCQCRAAGATAGTRRLRGRTPGRSPDPAGRVRHPGWRTERADRALERCSGRGRTAALLTPEIAPADLPQLPDTPPGGSPQHWGERILQRAILTTSHQVGTRVEAITDDPATTPYQLVIGTRRALADLNSPRTRWERASHRAPTSGPAPTWTSLPPRVGPPPVTTPPSFRFSH